MLEYIEREAAIQLVQKHMTEVNRRNTKGIKNSIVSDVYEMAIRHATDYLRIAPTADVVEIVRCKDCKHFLNDTYYCQEYNSGYCELDNTIKSRKHFCSYGERKEGAENE